MICYLELRLLFPEMWNLKNKSDKQTYEINKLIDQLIMSLERSMHIWKYHKQLMRQHQRRTSLIMTTLTKSN